jgi:hypothetical protein
MKSLRTLLVGVFVFFLLGTAERAEAAPASTTAPAVSNEVWSVFAEFVKEKHALTESLAKEHKIEMPSRVEDFFAAAQKGDWTTSSNLFYAMKADAGKTMPINPTAEKKSTPIELWNPVLDTYGAYELIHAMNPKFVKMFGADILKAIPAGSIYFGGNDPGYFLVSAFSQSHSEGRPFFTLSQNRLADSGYDTYVAEMYSNKISFVGTNDIRSAAENYLADWQQRSLHDKNSPNEPRQVMPGEDYHPDESGKVQIHSQMSAIAIYRLLAKTVFDINLTKEFYVAESFPLDWMFPHLTPSGLVLKINRAEIPELSEDILKQDHEYWSKYSGQLVGNWITYDTPLKDVTAFVEKVFLHKDYNGFRGDPDFIRDKAAQKAFSKMRSSIAGVYSWRLGQPPSGGRMPPEYIAQGAQRKLIEREVDFAFRQAFVLCPTSPEVIYRYVQLLVNAGRVDDALLVAETSHRLDPENTQLTYLINNLKAIKGQLAPPK